MMPPVYYIADMTYRAKDGTEHLVFNHDIAEHRLVMTLHELRHWARELAPGCEIVRVDAFRCTPSEVTQIPINTTTLWPDLSSINAE